MNIEKGIFRISIVLVPIFGMVAVVVNMELALELEQRNSYYDRYFDYENPTLVQRIYSYVDDYGRRHGPNVDPIIPLSKGAANVVAFLFGCTIPLLAYCASKYILAGFEEGNGE